MKNTIIGTFTGMCADANMTNLNGLDITREVWETVFASDEYQKAIELGHFIGYLGHPEDPACQDFEHACIVMTEGHIDSDGKVYGSFNLIDTPVGRIVKSFIDGGVTFGISVRGAGDITDNSVDPDTFIFRGFDLVTFPAYPDAIPEFTPVAASSDIDKQKKYKKVCAAVHSNIDKIDSIRTLEAMQTCVAAQSTPYREIEMRKSTLQAPNEVTVARQLDAMTDMYLRAASELKTQKRITEDKSKLFTRRIRRIKQIMASQMQSLADQLDREVEQHRSEVKGLRAEISASRKVQLDLKNKNLIYNQKLDAAQSQTAQSEADVAKMRSRIRETVTASRDMQSKMSNLDRENQRLRAELETMRSNLSDYQIAYAQLYATAVGGQSDVAINAATSVDELNRRIVASRITAVTQTDEVYETDLVGDDSITIL